MDKEAHMINKYKRIFTVLVTVFTLASFIPSFFSVARAADDTQPLKVVVPGTLQSELGCAGDWMPDCDKTALKYDAEDDVWQGTFQVTPGNDDDKKGSRYKVAIDGSWTINYGKNASLGGADIPLVVDKAQQVKFYFDNKTLWATDNFNTPIVVAFGDFQTQLGCKKNNDAGCLRSWLEDPEGSGTMAFTTHLLIKGTYNISLALNEDPSNLLSQSQSFTVANDGDEIYFGYDPMKKQFTVSTSGAPKGSLAKQQANWVDQDTLLWNVVGSPKYSYSLFYSTDASLALTSAGVTGGTEIPLTFSKSGPGGDVFQKNPYLGGYSAFKISSEDFDKIPAAVKGQLAIVARDDKGQIVSATGVQIPGVLDALYSYSGPLGVTFDAGTPTLRVWAPTAVSVKVHIYPDATSSTDQSFPLTWDDKSGVWSVTGTPAWKDKYYLYEVVVYVPSTGKIETNLVTDPYSISLSTNSLRSQVVDLNDSSLKTQDWDNFQKPALSAPEDIVIYELHIRDFSIHDLTVPENLRGTYEAFTVGGSDGMKHLAALADAGLTHIHLLPAFDIASVNEDKSTWQTVDENKLAAYPPDSDKQQAAVNAIKGSDGFNWGYDPYHYTVPEGSYSTDPNGSARVVEFRDMVESLNKTGLRVVMDVVYNHTTDSGQNPKSVLDKIVPGYYYRLNADGKVETSTCCQDTATEHAMMQKLMIDSVVTWARDYKVDGFRFDLMGFHMLDDMKAVRAALDALTLDKDGVDGKFIYIYGEGWDFGEVANNARGVNATQQNIGGTGIGLFNDRMRDAVRGGGPFDDPRVQGFSTGLLTDPNQSETRDADAQKSKLLDYSDWIRIGLAGNLKDFKLIRADGNEVDGAHILYNGSAAGYTIDPQENIVYVSAHDNATIFDAVQVKAPVSAALAERIRMNNLAISIPMFSQGVPFFHAGDDVLRSKSYDDNSYDSGDWFNKLDWTLNSDNWGVGLPAQPTAQWDNLKPLLADAALKPGHAEISNAFSVFQELLQIRKSSPLFRLKTAGQVEKSLTFLNVGPNQLPGLIVMRLSNTEGLDPNYDEILVLFNGDVKPVSFSDASFAGNAYLLHPVQQSSVDPVVRTASFDASNNTFYVPGLTSAVFVVKRTVQPTLVPTLTAAVVATVLPTVLPTAALPVPASAPESTTSLIIVGAVVLVAIILVAVFFLRKRLSK
jgi:pullulanase